MAKYTPTGWVMSVDGERRFREMYQRVEAIVRRRVSKYKLSGHDRDDLMQEGRLAAAYAVDTFQAGRGNLDGYISTVVTNALAMVATEALAQSRQPYKQVQDPDGSWRRVPVNHVELDDAMVVGDAVDEPVKARDHARSMGNMALSIGDRIDQLKLSGDTKKLLQLRLQTPPELWVLARNMNRGRMKLETQSVCLYLGWVTHTDEPDRGRYQRAARELRDQFRLVLGIDDMTFEPLKQLPMLDHHALQTGAKSRSLAGLRP